MNTQRRAGSDAQAIHVHWDEAKRRAIIGVGDSVISVDRQLISEVRREQTIVGLEQTIYKIMYEGKVWFSKACAVEMR